MKNQKAIILPIGYNGTDGSVNTGEQIEVIFFDLEQTIKNLKSVMEADLGFEISCLKVRNEAELNFVDGDEDLVVLDENIVYYPEGQIVIQFNIKHIEQVLLETEFLTLETLLSWTDC